MSPSLRFGRIVRIDRRTQMFVIKERGKKGKHYASAKDCASIPMGTNGNTHLSGQRPKILYKVRPSASVVFQTDGGQFAREWAPMSAAKALLEPKSDGRLASAKIGRRKYVGAPHRVARMIRLFGGGEVIRMKTFHRGCHFEET